MNDATAPRVVVVDDSALLREGVARLLTDAGFLVISTHADTDGLVAHVAEMRPELLVIDIRMPPTHTTEGLQAALAVRREVPGTAVLVLSQYVETRLAVDLIAERSDGVGYLLKDRVAELDEFIEAARRLCHGGSAIDPHVVSRLLGRERRRNPLTRLTDREREVLAHMAEGRSNQAIAAALTLTERTVEAHVRNIFTKLDLPPEADDHRRVRAVLLHLRSIDA